MAAMAMEMAAARVRHVVVVRVKWMAESGARAAALAMEARTRASRHSRRRAHRRNGRRNFQRGHCLGRRKHVRSCRDLRKTYYRSLVASKRVH